MCSDVFSTNSDTLLPFLKGHGTENDFVVLPDDDAAIDLTPELVRGLCDRHGGIGADGVLRIARAQSLVSRGVLTELANGIAGEHWFMDYRNADGTVAEMCGNGVRVFAHVLVDSGRHPAGAIPVGTRAGSRLATVDVLDNSPVGQSHAQVTVDMGIPELLGVSQARFGTHTFAGVAVDVGNPHLACVVPGLTAEELAQLPIDELPEFDAAFFPHGVNVEVATEAAAGQCHMRVHERGAGETRSCGTGIVATAMAVLADDGQVDGEVNVVVPGGLVHVALNGGRAIMTGPSRIVARGAVEKIYR